MTLIKRDFSLITELKMRFLLILSSTSLSVKALSFQRIKRSSKICDFENPDIPMSTDEENTIGYYTWNINNDYYRYDYYYDMQGIKEQFFVLLWLIKYGLTSTIRASSRLPKCSKMSIMVEMNVIAPK